MASSKERIEIITSVERRKRWSPEEKRAIINETYFPSVSLFLVACKHDINPRLLFRLRKLMENGALEAVRSGEELVPKSRVTELER